MTLNDHKLIYMIVYDVIWRYTIDDELLCARARYAHCSSVKQNKS